MLGFLFDIAEAVIVPVAEVVVDIATPVLEVAAPVIEVAADAAIEVVATLTDL
jgi:hypothetical protein